MFLWDYIITQRISMLDVGHIYLEDFLILIKLWLNGGSMKKKMTPLEIIGLLSIIYFGIRIAVKASKCIYYYCIKGSLKRNILLKQKGRWAVITGATDGIGKSYANALAEMGMNIVLISRSPQKLNTCAADIEAKHNVETKVIPIDFTMDIEIYDTIENELKNLEIGVLVNNVGISYSYPECFLDIPERQKFLIAIIRANIISVTKMCEIVMPGMVERKSGVVINISSASALIPAPMLTVYAATKRYVEKFSDELRSEYENQGLIIQTVLPGYVATKMAKIKKSTWMAPSADTFVKNALKKVGVFDHTTGYFPHTLFVNSINMLNNMCHPFTDFLVKRSMNNIRKRAIAALKRKTMQAEQAETTS